MYWNTNNFETTGYNDATSNEWWNDYYKVGIVVWIMIALGYWVMVLSFLQKAVKKKIVPKRIKIKFRDLQMVKQAEFLRQLMFKAS